MRRRFQTTAEFFHGDILEHPTCENTSTSPCSGTATENASRTYRGEIIYRLCCVSSLLPPHSRKFPFFCPQKKLAASLQILKKTLNEASSQAYQQGNSFPGEQQRESLQHADALPTRLQMSTHPPSFLNHSHKSGKTAERPAWTQPQPTIPATPRVPESDNDGPQHEVNTAICLLQSLLRGRAAQNEMFLGKQVINSLCGGLMKSKANHLIPARSSNCMFRLAIPPHIHSQAHLQLIKELRTRTEDAEDLRAEASRTAGFDTISGVAVASILSTAAGQGR